MSISSLTGDGRTELSEAELRQLVGLLGGLTDGLAVLDERWTLVWVNDAAARLLRRPAEELLGRQHGELMPETVGTVAEEHYRRAVDEQRSVAFELFYEPLDSWFEVHATPVDGGLVSTFRNVDERRRAEAERERLLALQRRATARSEALLQITSRLASALTLAEISGIVVHGVDAFGAYGGGVGFVAEDGAFDLVNLNALGDELERRWTGRFDLSLDLPMMNVARTGVLELYRDREAIRHRYPAMMAQFHGSTQGFATLPLVLGDRPIGALALMFSEPQDFDEDSVSLLQTVAGVCAQAIERGRLFAQERDTALTLQHSLLPRIDASAAPDLLVAARYLAGARGTTVGGDWYDVIALGSDRTALVVGDVMGRGVRAAALMGQVRSAVRSYARLDLPPAEVLALLDALVDDIGTDTGSDVIVTCLYAVYDPGDRTLTAASAGHPQPVVVDADEVGLLPIVPGPVLGTGDAVYTETTLPLRDGATLALYTDGLVEERARDVTDGQVALVAALQEDPHGDLDALCDRVLDRLGHGGPGADGAASDDVALLLLRSTPGPVPVAWLPLPDREPSRARSATRAELGGHVDDELLDDAVLLASELVTNAVMHGRPLVELRVRDRGDRVFLEVRDDSQVLPRRRTAGLDAEGGRGLNLVASLAWRWGWRAEGRGKVVWAELRPR